MENTLYKWFIVIVAIALTVVFGIQGLIAGYLLFVTDYLSDILKQSKLTNALLVEQLLLLTEEEEDELECGGDCEQCICGKL